MRKYSLDLKTEKKVLNEGGKDGEICLPPAKRTRLSVDNSVLSKALAIKQEPKESTQTHTYTVVKSEPLEQPSESDSSAPSDKPPATETQTPSVSNSLSYAAKWGSIRYVSKTNLPLPTNKTVPKNTCIKLGHYN